MCSEVDLESLVVQLDHPVVPFEHAMCPDALDAIRHPSRSPLSISFPRRKTLDPACRSCHHPDLRIIWLCGLHVHNLTLSVETLARHFRFRHTCAVSVPGPGSAVLSLGLSSPDFGLPCDFYLVLEFCGITSDRQLGSSICVRRPASSASVELGLPDEGFAWLVCRRCE